MRCPHEVPREYQSVGRAKPEKTSVKRRREKRLASAEAQWSRPGAREARVMRGSALARGTRRPSAQRTP